MGIPSYLSYIIKNYKGIISSLTKPTLVFNHLYFDANSIVYDCYRQLQEETKLNTGTEIEINDNTIIDKVIIQLENLISQINPTNTIFIALDGVAPFAKINQQRQRRFRVSASTPVKTETTHNNDTFSTIKITPGTVFMNILSLRLSRHFNKRAIISGAEFAGEGEHKIFQHIRANKHEKSEDENFVVYGLDADLVMLSINHLHISKNIFIFRETPEFRDLDSEILKHPYTLLNISKLAFHIEQHTGASAQSYMFLCFLLGNDFLPHFPALNLRTNGMDILLQSYKKNTTPTTSLIKNRKIQWRVLFKILTDIAKNEKELFIEKTRDRDNLEKRFKYAPIKEGIDPELHAPIMYRELEKYICPEEEGWESRYYKVLFENNKTIKNNDNYNKQIITESEICLNLLYGLEWTFKYYSGECVDWTWKYNYHYAPLISDFIKYIPQFETEFFNNEKGESFPLHPYVQLACVLPRKHLNLLPKYIYQYIENNYLWLYPEKIDIEYIYAYCRYNWEGHLVLPEITNEFLINIKTIINDDIKNNI